MDNAIVVAVIVAFTTGVTAGLFSLLNTYFILKLRVSIDGMKTDLVKVTARASEAEGHAEGLKDGIAQGKADAKARTVKGKK